MMTIPGYTVIAPVCEAGNLWLYRATREQDGMPVLLKVPDTAARPTALLKSRLEREFELARDLDASRVSRPIALERQGGKVLLVLDGGPDRTLASILDSPMDVTSFLRVGIGITAALAEIHRHELIHKDLKPEHVLMDAGGHVWLTGLGIASRLPRERLAPEPPKVIAGTLAYMAPEQTGRMNRSIDSRSDLYALGVIFYQMLTGVLPFTADDPMEWVHCHVARQAVPPSQRVPGLPEPLSAMLMKLLAKTAEERYQSTVGLDADLRRCLAQWESDGRIDPFPLGEHDMSERLLIPENLYGRQAEIDVLLAAFDRVVATGKPELVLVSGYSGVGKTAVVNELHKAMVSPRGLFGSGKFDQFKRDIPYATLIQALQTLVRQILGKSEAEVAVWREAFQQAVSPNGQLIVSLIPEVELIIGQQPPVADVPPQEARNRFQRVLQRFIGAFAAPEHPLALFLDDLQWLDAATLDLIEQLATEQEVRHLLLIGAYRDNEVGPAHPLTRIIEAIRKRGAGVRKIVLAPLSLDDVDNLVADSLHCAPERALPLAQLVYEKTGGNPFFTIQFLTALAEEKLLVFDPAAGRWTWDLTRIHAKSYTDNVVDLMVGKLNRLPAATLSALEQFACLGNVAEISMLTVICGQTEDALHASLWEAVRLGLVLRQERTYAFLHDRVREAAYSLIPTEERKAMHWKIGRLLLGETPLQTRDERFFDMLNHLNLGHPLLATPEEAAELVELNLQAGCKAMESAAFAAALQYFETGLGLLLNGSWQDRYPLALTLHQEAAEAACLCGRYDRLKDLAETAHQQAASLMDEIPIYETEIRALTAQGKLLPAIRHGLTVLERLGMRLPEEPTANEVGAHLERTLALLGQRTIEGILKLRPMTELDQLACIRILSALGEPAYAASPQFFLVWASEMAEISLRYGNSAYSPFAYAAYALALCVSGRQIEMGSSLAKAALVLIEPLEARSQRCRLLNIYGCMIQPWTEHLRDTLPTLQEAIDAGAESGDFTSGSYAAFNSCTAAFFMGEPLDKLSLRLPVNMGVIAGMRQTYIWNWVAFHLVAIQRLRGTPNRPDELGPFDEERWLASARDANDRCGLAYYLLSKLIACYLLGEANPGEGLACLDEVKANQAGFQAAFAVPVFYFYASLTLLKKGSSLSARDLDDVCEYRNKLEDLARLAPMNFRHKCDLLAAELARIGGEEWQAVRLYEQAIVGARTNGFLHEEAICCELTANFYLERGMEDTARRHIRGAHERYADWQAWAKVRALEAKYPPWLAPKTGRFPGAEAGTMDLETVMKAAHAIAGEMDMNRLLAEMMRIVVENAGARQGYLLLSRKEGLSLAAEARVENQNVIMQVHGEPGLPETLFPASIVNYVRRSRDKVLLDDATSPNPYSADEYFSRRHPKSVLCFPITKQTKLIGLLYLENDLATHAFTPERLAVLELLAAQAAISLENALVYEALQESESKYRRIVDTANEGIWLLGPDSMTTSVNARMVEMLGLKAEEMIGRPTTDFMFEEDAPDHVKRMENCRRGLSENYERRFRRNNGETLWTLASATPIFDEENNFKGAFAMFTDINERKRAEERMRLFFEHQLVGMAITSPEKGWIQVNDKICEMMGYTHDELLQLSWAEMTYPEDLAADVAQFTRMLNGEIDSYMLEKRFVRKDGSIVFTNLAVGCVRRADCSVDYVLALLEDITNRKRAEENIQKLNKELLLARDFAEAANKAKSAFLANMSHELRTPLNAILGFSNLVRRDPELPAGYRENLEIINRSGEHLLTLINDVLEIAKIEAGRMQLEIAPFDFGGMVRDVADMMELRAREKGLRLLLEMRSDVPRYLKGDEARLRQILIKLVGNAVKFTQQGGVTIRLGMHKNDRFLLMIEVEDSGPGIGAEDQQRLFKPFVQLAEGGDQDGTGLGLSITKQFVELMGGVIGVESTLGKGSLFRVDIPIEPAETVELAQPEVATHGNVAGLIPGQPRYRILIAEDQLENQLLLTRLMSDIGLDVKLAENGERCVSFFQEWHPDLIWMDWRMPVMDGEEAARRIRRLPGGDKVKIVAVTASVFTEERQEMLDAGMDAFVRKPYRFDEIYDCLARQLGVRYRYEGLPEVKEAPVDLTPAMFAALPEALRRELREVLQSLETEAITAAIRQVGMYDPKLEKALSRFARGFDYQSILNALDEAKP